MMRLKSSFVLAFLFLAEAGWGHFAQAELSPSKVSELREKSPEVLQVKVTAFAKADDSDGENLDVSYSVNVLKVVRTQSNVQVGDSLSVKSYIRNPAFQGSPEPGPRPPILLPVNWVGVAYLRGTDTDKTLEIAVFGYSFVPDEGNQPKLEHPPATLRSQPSFRIERDSRGHVIEATYLGAEPRAGLVANGAPARQDVATWTQLHESPDLRSVTIPWGAKLTSDDAQQLGRLHGLTELKIGTAEISSEYVEISECRSVLGKLQSLEELVLCKRDLIDADLEFIAQLPKLASLRFNAENYAAPLDGPFVTDRCTDSLVRSKSLRSIAVHEARHLTPEFIAKLATGLPSLERLELSGYAVIDENGLQSLARHPALRELVLPDLPLSDEQLQTLRNLATLERLHVDGSRLSRSSVDVFATMPNLRHCDVGPHDPGLQEAVDQILKRK